MACHQANASFYVKTLARKGPRNAGIAP